MTGKEISKNRIRQAKRRRAQEKENFTADYFKEKGMKLLQRSSGEITGLCTNGLLSFRLVEEPITEEVQSI